MAVKLILRDKEYFINPGMSLNKSLGKLGLQPEALLATREGEMITGDEILSDGEVIRLIAVISGGASDEVPASRWGGLER
jgi:sulfur carrier protein ThiS